VTLNGIHGGFKVTKESIQILQKKQIPVNRILCEPKLGKRNLYPTLKNNHSLYDPKIKNLSRQILNFLQYADGKNDIKKIAKLIRIDVKLTKELYKLLKKKKISNINEN
jgi:aminopeptidase-like protein